MAGPSADLARRELLVPRKDHKRYTGAPNWIQDGRKTCGVLVWLSSQAERDATNV